MFDDITIEMMKDDFIIWRCLHNGPLTVDTIDRLPSDSCVPWEHFRARNIALLDKLTASYGSCAVVARQGFSIIGTLRFYPKTVWELKGAGYLCLQQDFPAGPDDGFSADDLPPLHTLHDPTLKIHCLMTVPLSGNNESYRRGGIGTGMVRKLIEWAGENGWKRIEVEAFEDLPLVYGVTGSAGITFWEKLGFHLVDRFPHLHLREYPEFTEELESQARDAGIDPKKALDCIVMRLELA